MSEESVRSNVHRCLQSFLNSTGRAGAGFGDDTNLIQGLGLSSDEGVDFVLDLCEALHVELPNDFNPFIHENGRRGLRVSEMIRRVESLVAQTGVES